MPFYATPDAFYDSFKTLFERIDVEHPEAARQLKTARIAIRLKCIQPEAEIFLDARTKFLIHFGVLKTRPDLEVDLAADTLHAILMDQLSLKKATVDGLLKVRGPIWKLSALAIVIDAGRTVYPAVLMEKGLLQ